MRGIIVKLIGGTYSVCASDAVYECKARGVFRKKGVAPVCGDNVLFEVSSDGSGVIYEVLPRKSIIIRPPVANLDCLVLVNSVAEPSPNFELIDKFSAVAVFKNIEPVIVFTKTDLQSADKLLKIYKDVGFKSFSVDNITGTGVDELGEYLKGKISAFTGNTGVGKSSLLNNIFEGLCLDTAEVSKKLGRGKHTTRHTQLYPLNGGGYIADTPGFSTFETNRYDIIKKDELAQCFPEFEEYTGCCRFPDCTHTAEPGCEVIEAVNSGSISMSRYQSYKAMYKEAQSIKEWEIK